MFAPFNCYRTVTNVPHNKFSISARIRSIGFGARGVRLTLWTQHNAWIHAVATALVIVAGIYFNIRPAEWAVIVITSAAVWVAESLNTAIEFVADATRKEHDPLIRDAKDVAAGAVLIAVIAAIIVAVIIFAPYISQMISPGVK